MGIYIREMGESNMFAMSKKLPDEDQVNIGAVFRVIWTALGETISDISVSSLAYPASVLVGCYLLRGAIKKDCTTTYNAVGRDYDKHVLILQNNIDSRVVNTLGISLLSGAGLHWLVSVISRAVKRGRRTQAIPLVSVCPSE